MKNTLLSLVALGAMVPAYGQAGARLCYGGNGDAVRVSSRSGSELPDESAAARSVVVARKECAKSALHHNDKMVRAGSGGAERGDWGALSALRVASAAGATAGTMTMETGDSVSGGSLGEVIVTAQKYSQRAFDVPISMTVMDGPTLERLGTRNLDDLQFYVPGMLVQNEGTSFQLTIRGISNVVGQSALVGSYLDEADVTSEGSFGLDLNTYDLARVEVLKGPQGTLYGEGSVGGTIRYITNKPNLADTDMSARVTAMFDQYGAPEERVDAMLNSPIIKDVLGLRIAADIDQGGGWVDQPAANRKNINSKNAADVRIQGRWEPLSDVSVNAMEVIHRATSGPYIGEDPPGVYTEVFNLTVTPQLVDNYNISNLTVDWRPGPITLVNSTTYFKHYNNESNFGASFQFSPPPSPRFDDYYTWSPIIDESFSDELRVSGGLGGWRWMVGAFFKRLDDEIPAGQYYFGLPGPPGSPLPEPFSAFSDTNSNSHSLFVDTSYEIFSGLVVGAGARYFRDNQNALITGDASREVATFTSADPRFYVRYGLSNNINVYASAAKGFRSGGFNGLGYPSFDPEHVWTYELGSKAKLLHGSMSVNADVFLSEYGGYQVIGVLPSEIIPLDIYRNAGDARVKGIEGDVEWTPVPQWRLGLSGDYIDARFVEIAVVGASHQVGDPLDLVPRYQVTAWGQREFNWGGRSGFARLDYTQRAPEVFRNRSIGPWYYSQSDYMYLLGFHTGINWTDNLQLGVFALNLLNDRGYTGSDVIEMEAARQQPRTFGVEFDVRLQ